MRKSRLAKVAVDAIVVSAFVVLGLGLLDLIPPKPALYIVIGLAFTGLVVAPWVDSRVKDESRAANYPPPWDEPVE